MMRSAVTIAVRLTYPTYIHKELFKMKTLTWRHTRTGKPMALIGELSTLLAKALFIRSSFPHHKLYLNGTLL
jgi:hypothetical protein